MKRIAIFSIALVSLAAAMFAVACGGDNPLGDKSTPAPSVTAQATQPSGGSGQNQSGQPQNGNSSGNTQGTTTQAASGCPDQDHEMQKGDSYQTHQGCSVKGDVWLGSTSGSKEFKGFSGIANIGTLTTCSTTTCWVFAEFAGANVSPRTVPDLKAEMLNSGCGSKCADVKTLCWPNACSSASSAQTATTCGPELQSGESRLIRAGCIIVGDVAARKPGNSDWVWTTDSVTNTGSVQKLTTDLEILAPKGAGVHDSNENVDNLVLMTKIAGCDTGHGCASVIGWLKQP